MKYRYYNIMKYRNKINIIYRNYIMMITSYNENNKSLNNFLYIN